MVDFKKLLTPEGKAELEKKIAEQKYQLEIHEQNRKISCAFTGHRPKDLPGGYDWYHPKNIELGRVIRDQIINLIENEGVSRFIFGGALGVDMMAFSVCQKLKESKYNNLCLILALPYAIQGSNWFNQKDKDRLEQQKQVANDIVIVDELQDFRYKVEGVASQEYHPLKLQKRNEWMVDNAKYLIAVWNGSKGGTGNCVRYFSKNIGTEKMLVRIHPVSLEIEVRY